MYANLIVRVETKPLQMHRPAEVLYAWKIEGGGEDNKLLVFLDGNDGNGNYAEPAGEREIDLTTHAIDIQPCF